MVRPDSKRFQEIQFCDHDDVIPSLFELQSAKEINDIIQSSLSSNHPLEL